ncbi:bifunctional enoyl-CoA hydratase/phosphate acetyltransferase [Guyparkeria halophila]|uniref:Bifunctional enoyl-CoA hydratase/phosphate acetyltransferase n=1 Tax=Guyparkeria halophila TaxID=47960 RepID=A0A6I6CX88_9GAMM|nr:bifunctional enoyl-CoA hydratase/phosphate acetyltransferase [Guyparkeria halophila]QGT77970.1 bifunctional enoyl-CoA hydratase/phosphate acetyltransferase [Guyparkeria halophila]
MTGHSADEIRSLDQLIEEARGLPPAPTAVVGADEAPIVEAARHAADAGLIEPVLIGRAARIEALMAEQGVSFPVVDAAGPEQAARAGVDAVESGRVSLLMKGAIHSDVFLRPIIRELRRGPRISHVFMAEMASYHKLLFITDAAINIQPDVRAKAEILQNAVNLTWWLGNQRARVAALSAIEMVNPAIPSTLDAACLAKMGERGQIAHAQIDGPLAFDTAISGESARIKGLISPVAGHADILLVPDLVSGNILYKDLEYLAGARFAGIVLGACVPVVLTSRADPEAVRIASLALARVASHRQAEVDPLPPFEAGSFGHLPH